MRRRQSLFVSTSSDHSNAILYGMNMTSIHDGRRQGNRGVGGAVVPHTTASLEDCCFGARMQ